MALVFLPAPGRMIVLSMRTCIGNFHHFDILFVGPHFVPPPSPHVLAESACALHRQSYTFFFFFFSPAMQLCMRWAFGYPDESGVRSCVRLWFAFRSVCSDSRDSFSPP